MALNKVSRRASQRDPDPVEQYIAGADDAAPAPPERWQRANRTQITLSIAPELLKAVDAIAHRKHMTRAALVTLWLGDRVEQDAADVRRNAA